MGLVDVLIIGAGPAGLSAALGLSRLCRSALVFDSQEHRNESALMMNNVLTHDGTNPAVFRAKCMNEITTNYGSVQFIDQKITSAVVDESTPGSRTFKVTDSKGHHWSGKKLLLATGSIDVLPEIDGFRESWGRDIYHCLLCDGYERRNQEIGMLEPKSAQDFGHIYMSFAMTRERVTIFTNGQSTFTPEVEHEIRRAKIRGCVINIKRIASISQSPGQPGLKVVFDDGSDQRLGFMIYHPEAKNRAQHLIDSLDVKCHLDANSVLTSTPFGHTNVKGCFVTGDHSTPWKIVPTAISTGSLAAIGIGEELAIDETDKIVNAEVSSMWSS